MGEGSKIAHEAQVSPGIACARRNSPKAQGNKGKPWTPLISLHSTVQPALRAMLFGPHTSEE